MRAAADRRLPRTREPDLPRRDPQGGAPGTATFKWSRDNARSRSPVVEMLTDGTAIRSRLVGKDDVLRFHDGDWVEILDDDHELDAEPGELRKVRSTTRTGTIALHGRALPADLQPTIAPTPRRGTCACGAGTRQGRSRIGGRDQPRRPRPARGDRRDHGAGRRDRPHRARERRHRLVLVGGRTFRPGDHWIFAARTADTSVEDARRRAATRRPPPLRAPRLLTGDSSPTAARSGRRSATAARRRRCATAPRA